MDVQNEFDIHTGNNYQFGECIVIPVDDIEGKFIFNKYRRNPMEDIKPKYTYDKGAKVSLYAMHKAKDHKRILITEGEMDTLVAWSANVPAVTSTGGAMSFQKEWSDLFTDKEVVLCFDNDPAGAEGMVKTLAIIPHAKILFIPDKPNVKDISDYVSSGGDLNALMETSQVLNTMESVISDRTKRIAKWQSVHFHDAFIDAHKERVIVKKVFKKFSDDKLENAKAYPMGNLIEINNQKKAVCPFHNDHSPSMHYYEKTNTLYCFVCSKVADPIEVYMKQNTCSFKEALDNLNAL